MGISLLCVMGLSLPALGGNMPVGPELSKLQGEWMLVETTDEHRTDPGNDNIRMEIKDTRIVMKFHETVTNQGTLAVQASDGFPGVDMRLGESQPVKGIFSLENDVLILCFDKAGKPRPEKLKPTGTQWQEKWQRLRK